MKILVDTHFLIWLATADDGLSRDETELLEDENNEIYFSPISIWEIAIKYRLNKLNIGNYTPKALDHYLKGQDFKEVQFDSTLSSSSYELAFKENHKDPFDRMLIWQAIQNDLVLLSRDEKFRQYIEDGLLLKQMKK